MMKKEKMIIAGGTGFMGSALAAYFCNSYNVVVLTRNNGKEGRSNGITYLSWDGCSNGYWQNEIEGAAVVINLSGRSVDCRYNEKNKKDIYDSRLNSTKIIGETIERCVIKPALWINAASATIYRHSEDRPMTELDGEIGTGFSVDVCRKWEDAFYRYNHLGIRLIALRTAIVLGRNGGVMKPFRALAKFGLGGAAGNGKQMFSWIHINDFCRAVEFLIDRSQSEGTYNITAPGPVPNKVFMKSLRNAMGIHVGISLPVWVLKVGAVLIKTETELLLKSRWVRPERLTNEGFEFRYGNIDEALKDLCS